MRRNAILGIYLICCSRVHSSRPTPMNKIIFTNDRLFMSLVGPSGSGKTRFIFSMLASQTFYPKFAKNLLFLQGVSTNFQGDVWKVGDCVCSLSGVSNDQGITKLFSCFRRLLWRNLSRKRVCQVGAGWKTQTCNVSSSSILCFIRVNCLAPSIWTLHTLYYSSLHEIYTKSIILEGSWKKLIFYDILTANQRLNPTAIYWLNKIRKLASVYGFCLI